MDGKSLLRALRQVLNESSTSSWLDTRSSYEYLYRAVIEFVDRTNYIKNTQSITTVAETSTYDLNANFLKLYMENPDKKRIIKYYDGTTTYFLQYRNYETIYYENNTTSQLIPDYFSIINKSSIYSQATGTATSAGAASAGQCTLTDTAGDFTYVSAGDIVNNTTDGSTGYVLSKTSTTVLVTALFDGTNNDWSSSDAYVVQPQGRMSLTLDPPPSTASHTITVPYIQRPDPVFSDYGMYPISQHYLQAIVSFAAFLYKYRDREPNFGDAFFKFFDRSVNHANVTLGHVLTDRKWTVSFK